MSPLLVLLCVEGENEEGDQVGFFFCPSSLVAGNKMEDERKRRDEEGKWWGLLMGADWHGEEKKRG